MDHLFHLPVLPSNEGKGLTPNGPKPFFGPFLKFGKAIVDAIFVQKVSNFWWTCGLVLALRGTNFYEIPISSLGAVLQRQLFWSSTTWATNFYLFLNFLWLDFFFNRFLTKLLIIPSTWKFSKTHGIMLKDQLHLHRRFLQRCSWFFNISQVNSMCLRTFSS